MKLNLEEPFYLIAEFYNKEFQGFIKIETDENKILSALKQFKSKNKTEYAAIKCDAKLLNKEKL